MLFSIFFTINVGIGTYFIYSHCYLKKDVSRVKFNTRTQTTIQLLNLSMGEVEQIKIKYQTYFLYNDMINLKDFELNLLKIDKKYYKEINNFYNGYITILKNDDFESIYHVNSLYLRINHASGYIEEQSGNK